ncbi:MAG: hypothetical protein HY710_03295 [Candidatus Latescibacteria bacterium]|nr:hypothetical protein [Candidatus Latescibacterota bacterium]
MATPVVLNNTGTSQTVPHPSTIGNMSRSINRWPGWFMKTFQTIVLVHPSPVKSFSGLTLDGESAAVPQKLVDSAGRFDAY